MYSLDIIRAINEHPELLLEHRPQGIVYESSSGIRYQIVGDTVRMLELKATIGEPIDCKVRGF